MDDGAGSRVTHGEGTKGVTTAGRTSSSLESELENVCRELELLEQNISQMLQQQTALCERREQLSAEIQARKKRRVLPERDWSGDDFEWSQSMADLLRGTFGLKSWRTNQKEIVNATLSGRDVFVVMRTGGGKSLCYQLPALLQGGITVVVSPLISLIEDQMRYLNSLVPGSAAMLSAGMDKKETADVYRRMRGEPVEGDGEGTKLVMVLVTPEKVVKSKMFMAALDKTAKNRRLARVVIDEAHCCSQWGHDFRPEYCKLGILKRQFSHVPILAVTATCTDFIRDDVMKILNLTPADVVCFKSSFNRANLRYEVLEKSEVTKDALEQLASFIRNNNYSNEAGIVYAFSRKEASDVAAGLASRGIPAAFYHAGQEEGDRSRIQQAWMRGDVPVIVATIAFGMGINHLEVRFVVHFSISKSLENYYQESGRAGRDGRPSRCAVFYRPSDVSRQATLSCQDQGSQPIATLHKMVAYCQAMGTCRRKMIAEALGEQGGKGMCVGGCDICAGDAEAFIAIDATPHASTLVSILRYLASKEQRVTPRQLVEAWRAKKGAKAMPAHVVGDSDRPNRLSRSTCERLVLHLLGLGVLSDDFHFTAFSVVHYVVTGARAHALESGRLPRVSFEVPEGKLEIRAGGKKTKAKHTAASGTDSRRGGGEARARGGKDARGNDGSSSGDSRPDGRDRGIKNKALNRGNNLDGRGKKRASLEVDDATAVVDLCETEDEESYTGGDGHEKSQERSDGRNGYRREGGGGGGAGAVGARSGDGGNFGGGRSSGSCALEDDGDSDYFEAVVKKRPRKTAAKKTKEAERVFDDSD